MSGSSEVILNSLVTIFNNDLFIRANNGQRLGRKGVMLTIKNDSTICVVEDKDLPCSLASLVEAVDRAVRHKLADKSNPESYLTVPVEKVLEELNIKIDKHNYRSWICRLFDFIFGRKREVLNKIVY